MSGWWLVVGTPENWQTAFLSRGIWGLRDSVRHRLLWEQLKIGDKLVFYATSPISGVIGYGELRNKFRQHIPLWPEEVKRNEVIWPNRFEFDVIRLISQEQWMSKKILLEELKNLVRGGFQPLNELLASKIVKEFESIQEKQVGPVPTGSPEKEEDLHAQLKRKLVEIGKIQNYIADEEFPADNTRLDVVWRRVERGAPTYVFEVQIGGDLYHALAKLKHAYDLWNSRIFLVASLKDQAKVSELLGGTFHEIKEQIRLVEFEKINELFELKRRYKEFESALGIS